MILGYLSSCIRETIDGGVITIGARQSTVEGGLVVREIVECDGGQTDLSVAEASQSGVITFRAGEGSSRGTRDNPIRVFSLSPAFLFPDPVELLSIERLDLVGEPIALTVDGTTVSGNLGDFAVVVSRGSAASRSLRPANSASRWVTWSTRESEPRVPATSPTSRSYNGAAASAMNALDRVERCTRPSLASSVISVSGSARRVSSHRGSAERIARSPSGR